MDGPLGRGASPLDWVPVIDFGLNKGFLGSAAGATAGVGDGLSGTSRIGAGKRCAVIKSSETVRDRLSVRLMAMFCEKY